MSQLLSNDVFPAKCELLLNRESLWVLENIRNDSKALFNLVNRLIEQSKTEEKEEGKEGSTEHNDNVFDNLKNAIKDVRQSLYKWDALYHHIIDNRFDQSSNDLFIFTEKVGDYNIVNDETTTRSLYPPSYTERNAFRKLNYNEIRDVNCHSEQEFSSSSSELVSNKTINDDRCQTDSSADTNEWTTTTAPSNIISDDCTERSHINELKTIYDLDLQTESLLVSNQLLPTINYQNDPYYNEENHAINYQNTQQNGFYLNTFVKPISGICDENDLTYSDQVIVYNRIELEDERKDDHYNEKIACNSENECVYPLIEQKVKEEDAICDTICDITKNTIKEALYHHIIDNECDHTNNDLLNCSDYSNGNDDTASNLYSLSYTAHNSFRKLKYSEFRDENYIYSSDQAFSTSSLESLIIKTINDDRCQTDLSVATNEWTATNQSNITSDGSCERDDRNELKSIYDDSDFETESLIASNQMLPSINYSNNPYYSDKLHAINYSNAQQNGIYLNSLINPISDSLIIYNHNATEDECKNYDYSKEKIDCNDETQSEMLDKSYSTAKEIILTEKSNRLFRLRNKLKRLKKGSKMWYKCGYNSCSFGSLYSGVVERHKTEKHNGFGKTEESTTIVNRFDCDWPNCGTSLVTYHKLVEHMRKHTGEKPFKCKRVGCNYATGRKYSMRIHDRTHMVNVN